MKRILLILLLFPFITFSQSSNEVEFDMSEISGTDTVLFFTFYSKTTTGIEFDYSDFDADDATLSPGNTNFGYTFNKVDDSRFPYTLDVTTNEASVNGTTYATLFITKDTWGSKYAAIKVTKGSVTSGTLTYKWVR